MGDDQFSVPGQSAPGSSPAEADAVKRLRKNASAYLRSEAGAFIDSVMPTPGPTGPSRGGPRYSQGGDGSVSRARQAAEDLYEELTEVVESRIEQLDQALLAEGQVMLTVLSAATDRFLDLATQTPDVEFEYLDLCAPIQRVLWPDIFDGGPAQLGASLSQIESAAATLSSAAATIRTLEQ